MTTRRKFFAVVAGLVSAVATKTAWANPSSWFKPVKPERRVEVVINLPRSNWNVLAELLRKQLAGQGGPITDCELTEGILRRIERALAEPENKDPLSVTAMALSAPSVGNQS